MNVEQLAKRPPYVRFGYVDVEDRAASIEKGYYSTKSIATVYITPPGSKDVIERNADEWLQQMADNAMRGYDNAYPLEWVAHFKAAYQAWKDQEELPEIGTPIKTWAVLSPEEKTAILQANVRTVEDLAIVSEDAMNLIGMGSRTLKQKAMDWLDSASQNGRIVQEMAALRVKNNDLEALLKTAMETIEQLKAELPKRGRPRNEDREAA